MFNFRKVGVNFKSASNITFDDNVILHIQLRETFVNTDKIDKWAGVSVCTIDEGVCSDFRMRRNIVAGAPWVGFTAPGYACGLTNDQTFRDNVAHSVNYEGVGGHGAIIYNTDLDCMEGSHFTGYKA